MANNYESGLKGTADEAIASQKLIAKHFVAYGTSGLEDAAKHQLIYATKVMHSIAKCDLKNATIFCDIIMQIFADHLQPEASAKYWDSYVDSLRYFHYSLACKKEHKLASLIYNHISLYNQKLANESVFFKLANIYSYHLILQTSLQSTDRQTAEREALNVLDNMTYLFQEMLEKNKTLNYQYQDILKKSLHWLFPQSGQSSSIRFFSTLSDKKVSALFESIFKLTTQQRKPMSSKEDLEHYGQTIIESLYTLLQFDITTKFRLQLSVKLLNHCRLDSQLTGDQCLGEFYSLLYEYMKLLTLQTEINDFPKHFLKRCQHLKEFFDLHSKTLMHQSWFQDFLVVLNYLHSQMQNSTLFSCFWQQMSSQCFNALIELLLEIMKLSPCITSETTLNWIKCCSSFRKHIIISFAQIALSTFVIYCQNITSHDEDKEGITAETYNEGLHKNLLMIINHAFKVMEKMNCIDSTSQDINHLITRYKQATTNAKNEKQANTCMSLCELFLKIKSKIPDKEWPLILRRLYKVIEQCMPKNKWQLKKELQMCYIASLLQLETELDFTQIKAQITIYYTQTVTEEDSQETQFDKCLMHQYLKSKHCLKPHLSCKSKNLLHWLETQHILKYHRTNDKLKQSLIQTSQTQYDFILLARMDNGQTAYCMPKLVTIQNSLKTKAEEATYSGLMRLELLVYGHACATILQDKKSSHLEKASKLDSKDFLETQLELLLPRKEVEMITIRKELSYVKLAYSAFKAFEGFYEKFDLEFISSDDALIDWEALVEDLIFLAQFLQLAGYIEYSSQAWLLVYKISHLIQDQFAVFRALTFICEYSELFGHNTNLPFDVDKEIELHFPSLTYELENLPSLSKRKVAYVLIFTIQIAYYYARCSKYSFAEILLQFVELKHNELPDRQGKYDVIMCAKDIVHYRILWKHGSTSRMTSGSSMPKLLPQRNLLYTLDKTLDRFRTFVFLTSSDSMLYIILLCNLLQDITECSANRLYDNIMCNLFPAMCKCIYTHGLALRMAQIMCSWMWMNLQMELVDEAHTKLRILEYVMGVVSLKQLSAIKLGSTVTDMKNNCLSIGTPTIDNMPLAHNVHGIESMRRVTQVQISPIRTGKLRLSSIAARKHELKNYLTYKIEVTSIPSNELFEWLYFIIGCFNARLNFLIEDFGQLEEFYDSGREWLQNRKDSFHLNFFKSFSLIAMQHYANFLRARKQYDKAEQCLNYALDQCKSVSHKIDPVYYINFKLQKLLVGNYRNDDKSYQKDHRYLSFNSPPTVGKDKYILTKEAIKNELIQKAMSSCKKKTVNVVVNSDGMSTKIARPIKDAGPSGFSNPEEKTKTKSKPKFNICKDSIEIMDFAFTNTEGKKDNKKASATSKKHKTETKTPSKNKINNKKPIVCIDILDSPTLICKSLTSSSASSLHSLDSKENDIVKQMENLIIAEPKKNTASASRGRPRKTPVVPTALNDALINLDDSPIIKSVEKLTTRSRLKINKSPKTAKKKETPRKPKEEVEKRVNVLRRQRRVIDEIDEQAASSSPSSSSSTNEKAAVTSASTRRRQQI